MPAIRKIDYTTFVSDTVSTKPVKHLYKVTTTACKIVNMSRMERN